MSLQDIPIIALGPGSQPGEVDGSTLSYINMPEGMSTYEKPSALAKHDISRLAEAREAVDWLGAALASYRPVGDGRMASLDGLDEANRKFLDELLGEGEVSVNCRGTVNARVQESVLAGVWRCHYVNDEGAVVHDLLEVGDVPYLVRMPQPGRQGSAAALRHVVAPPGLMNAQPILSELSAHAESYHAGDAARAINLTLLPMSDEDVKFLDQALGKGPVEILSRSYGQCLMSQTEFANIWWVRYYNSTGTLILNSLEVVDVPLVARAAVEDIADSGRRLAEIVQSEGLEKRGRTAVSGNGEGSLQTGNRASTPLPRFECRICWYVYDPESGDGLGQVPPGTSFSALPDHWRCPECDADKRMFLPVEEP